ncbi:restriction endonuclease [Geodermatophilus maliterrae]|uniref:Restriction endonuclease n=1 Tax=Geodermatophilus maliterrae TaxID=3162531 RepID=A0ABV3XN00_9ACTN
MALWMVRSGRHGEGDEIALSRRVVGIGWSQAGDLSDVTTTDELQERLIESYPDAKPSTISNWVGQVDAFQRRMADGDLVALPLKTEPIVAIGRVAGPYGYVPDAPESLRHQRPVTWLREVPRDAIDQDILYSLGAFLTVCRIQRNDAEARVRQLLARPDGSPPLVPAPPTEELPAVDTDRQPDADLDRVLDRELPHYAEALERLGQ